MTAAKLHFREINLVIYFPETGNEGREFEKYGVAYRDRKIGVTQPGPRINLHDVLNEKTVSENYPHTVSYFLDSAGKGEAWAPNYLKTRVVKNKTELFGFLSELGL